MRWRSTRRPASWSTGRWPPRSGRHRGCGSTSRAEGGTDLAEQPVRARPGDGGVPAELGELPGQGLLVTDEFDQLVTGSVAQLTLDDLARSGQVGLAAGGVGQVVDEQHAAVTGQRAADH